MNESDCSLTLGVVGLDLCNDKEILQGAQIAGLDTVLCRTFEDLEEAGNIDVFVVSSFEGSDYKKLRQAKKQAIIGPPYLLYKAAMHPGTFDAPGKPVYCLALEGAVICFTGLYDEVERDQLVSFSIKMGARVKFDVSLQVTHLVAANTFSSKYRLGVSLGCEIVSTEWIHQAWAQKDEHLFSGLEKEFVSKYKLAAFYNCKMAIYGFGEEEKRHMEDIAEDNGAQVVDLSNQNLALVVVDDAHVVALPEIPSSNESPVFVRAEWFWVSVQMQVFARPEMFPFVDKINTPLLQKAKTPRSGGNNSNSKKTKRRRLQDNLSLLAQDDHSPASPAPLLNVDSFGEGGSVVYDSPDFDLATSGTPTTPKLKVVIEKSSGNSTPTPEENQLIPKTKRHEIIMELYQTETNYLQILQTIIREFKEPLEAEEANGNSLIDIEDRKTIFDKLPNLLAVHSKIQSKLFHIVKNWKEDVSIGNIFLESIDDLQKSYPPFVNFFEIAKETLDKCDKGNPRFHAFLKVRATKPECGRQSLSDLFIRPVQRLPSVLLLVTDLLKKTEESHFDHRCIEEALEKLKGVTSHINEDKRKTESRLEMLSIANTIENIPAVIISSHRQLVASVDAVEISGQITVRTEQLCLFLFSDCLLVAKKRSKAMKSPGVAKTPQTKSCKYLAVISLGQVKRIVDIEGNNDASSSSFALVYKPQIESCEKLFAFNVTDITSDKVQFIKTIAEQMSITQMRTDSENLISIMPASELNLELSTEGPNLNIGKAISKVAKKTSMKVSQALTGSAGKSLNTTKDSINPRVSTIVNTVTTPIRSNSRGFLFSRKLVSTVDLTSPLDYDDKPTADPVKKRTLPDRTSALAESSLSLSRNNFG